MVHPLDFGQLSVDIRPQRPLKRPKRHDLLKIGPGAIKNKGVETVSKAAERLAVIQAQQQVYEQMRETFGELGSGGRYSQRQKEHALRLVDDLGVRATARVLRMPRRTLQRWCRADCRYVRRCPVWVHSWAEKRRKRREFWTRRGYC